MKFERDHKINQDLDHDSSPILKFFNSRNQDEISRMVDEMSDEARDFFDVSLLSMVGTIPSDLVMTTVTTDKETLKNLLYSAMVTGYVAKTVEDKVKLEKVWNS